MVCSTIVFFQFLVIFRFIASDVFVAQRFEFWNVLSVGSYVEVLVASIYMIWWELCRVLASLLVPQEIFEGQVRRSLTRFLVFLSALLFWLKCISIQIVLDTVRNPTIVAFSNAFI